MDTDYADDIALLANTPAQVETLPRVAAGIGLHVNAGKTEYICFNQRADISTLNGISLKLVDKFTYLGSSVSSTEKEINTRLGKEWTALDRLSVIWKSNLTNEMKRSFFQAVVVSILLYGYTTWTLTKRIEKRLEGNYTRVLRAILNNSWRQQHTKQQLYGHLSPISKSIKVRWTRHAGHCWKSKNALISDILWWTLHMNEKRQDDQQEPIYDSSVQIQDVALKTCRERWTIEMGGERGSGRSVLPARHDEDDDILFRKTNNPKWTTIASESSS